MPVSTLGRPSVARVAQRYLIVCASLASLCTLTECVCPAASAAAEVPAAAERGGRAPLSKLPPVRANAALVAVPDGWKRLDEASGGISFVPPDDPRGERVKIMVAPPEPPRPTLRDHLEADLKAGAEKLT